MFLIAYLLKLKNIFKRNSDDKLDFFAEKLSKQIKLEKPLIIFNVKTTGWSLSTDRIFEITYIKIWQDGRNKKGRMLFNPETKLSKESNEIHGIKDSDLADSPIFKKRSQELWDLFYNCCYGGFNIVNFDLPMLKREFLRAGMDFNYSTANILDARSIYGHMEVRTMASIYKFYCGKNYKTSKHDSMAGIKAIAETLEKQIDTYKFLNDWDFAFRVHNMEEQEAEDVKRKFYWKNGQPFFSFSKYKDLSLSRVAEIDPDYLKWMIGADFSEETKNIVGFELRKVNKKKYKKNI